LIDLSGTVAIVTGSSRGIGQGIALRLAEQGADVALVALNDEAGLRSTADRIARLGRRSLTYDADVAVESSSREIVADVVARLGGLHILVNNAGGGQPAGIFDLTPDSWRRTLSLNLDSAFYWTRAAVPFLVPTGRGRVVMTSSMSAKNGGGGPPFSISKSAYAAAKSGLLGLARGLAVELGPSQVTVNAVCPGPIHTQATESIMGGELGRIYSERVPVRRLGTPDDVAAAVAFLCSREAGFITGECLDVNGGFYID
jgi:3-oxoacyl-[acyl-carrier protein] reductase